ncbi:hypothetical protein [Paenibacillus endoradicis]|uniref:hypothetical protein n=1 Tax=Paenibacillus endoradicis TaxID=2972487 RepID=UPI0021593049|nr:hypothetical protein [Paenibacillus endoradicis]MCR8660413.1 hypothetical protein [Paenibacillus endoradicis]
MKLHILTRNRVIGIICLLAAITIGLFISLGMSSGEENNEVVFTIDTYEVKEAEFNAILQEKKALTTSYFKQTYNVDYSENFWTTTYEGENPLEYAKQQVMDQLLLLKIEQILMKENEIVSDISYDSFLKNLEIENIDRQNKIKNNEPIYGPKVYGTLEYYSYLHSINYQKLVDKLTQEALAVLSDDAIQQMYEEMKQLYFHKGYNFKYEKITIVNDINSKEILEKVQQLTATKDISVEQAVASLAATVQVEELALNINEASKDDTLSYYLNELFTDSNEGDFNEIDTKGNELVMYRLLEKQDKGFEKFDDVKSAVIQIHVKGQLEQKVSQRLSQANVQINENIYNKLVIE